MIGQALQMDKGKTPSKVYAVLDPAYKGTNVVISNGGLTRSGAGRCFLTMEKTTGYWAIEVSHSAINQGSVNIGMSTNYTLDNYSIGWDTYKEDAVGCEFRTGSQYREGVAKNIRWDSQNTINTKYIVVLKPDTSDIWLLKSGVLLIGYAYNPRGLKTIGTFHDNLGSMTINTGQSPFSATNEALVAALATSLGNVVINRGIWE